ncbi:hypothetical protein BHE90_009754 [Fusarium euwallaceae]|uniref:Conidiation-specific expression protein n=6 Tax=Fusarium solani species complex TaxID=232080 RepID=A0A428P729_9HYPO|nr:hypothetical protein CDV36_013640 [Fusarium kuroshium]RSL41656.1 hypothetical protein CEP53_012635 [Fusarium sp. AF-6]RSL48769.1 hypothetical protein CEP54_012755 [Fusarium duplospermum]RSL75353.1 hypothetical protein CEP51_010942 [Fusarium floridanum]RSL93998.1 hypothetical protein CDV31_014481 [Fusarium ambrosium]RSM16444.1 hypothetical protein CEP52_000180 [Fusarium oligoseptatum]RTE75773.1 hypothetical protein BHE90_009754 [Fusarium euwallaceae]
MDSGAPQNNQNTNASGRRRSSGFMPAFASLQQQKRGSEANAARRASMSDQQAKGGIFSQFFHNNFGKNAEK